MAKRKSTQSATATEEAPKRESFLPEVPKEDVTTVATAEVPEFYGKDFGPLSVELKIDKRNEREMEVTLVIPPLDPCVEIYHAVPLNLTPEVLAAILAQMIQSAARSAEANAIQRKATREREEREAKQRFAAR